MEIPQWAQTAACAITVCDAQGVILFMNEQAKAVYASRGNLIGYNLRNCHGPRALAIIDRLLAEGGTNAYTIEKGEVHKVIYQTAWRDESGAVAGLMEISMIVDWPMPHYVRK